VPDKKQGTLLRQIVSSASLTLTLVWNAQQVALHTILSTMISYTPPPGMLLIMALSSLHDPNAMYGHAAMDAVLSQIVRPGRARTRVTLVCFAQPLLDE